MILLTRLSAFDARPPFISPGLLQGISITTPTKLLMNAYRRSFPVASEFVKAATELASSGRDDQLTSR